MGTFGSATMTVAKNLRRTMGGPIKKGLASIDPTQLRMSSIRRAADVLQRRPLTPVRMKVMNRGNYKQHFSELYGVKKYVPKSYHGVPEGIYNLNRPPKTTGALRSIKERVLESRALRMRDVKLGNMSTIPIQPLNMAPTTATRLFSGKNPFFDRFSRFR